MPPECCIFCLIYKDGESLMYLPLAKEKGTKIGNFVESNYLFHLKNCQFKHNSKYYLFMKATV